jgi:outer membrane protein TolC
MSGDAFRDKDLDAIAEQLELSGERLTADFTKSREDMETLRADLPNLEVQEVRSRLAAGLADFSGLLLELSLARASARLEAIVMEDVRVEAKEALEVARERRLDWMNARAKLVDVWRDAALARDDLRSDLDLVLSGDVGSNRSDAGHFKADEGRLSFGLQFDTPLSKLAERNDYREALINYQRARRDYLAYQDGAYRSLRNTARIARLSQLNFELARSAVRGAIAQVDLARLRLQQPPQPGKNAQFGATTARDLVNALNDLLDASNAFLQVWVGYEALRMRLDFELGTMRLNEEGLWLDPGPILARKFMPKEKNEPMPAP